ncbi:MAG TPA: PIN domain-containing protein [Thermodesulfovibrionales bacterium]|jgi:predicted nucleic acid-binding protein|nr:PIN domain-containing protein [Thermodesulfovibrionales bacterium]
MTRKGIKVFLDSNVIISGLFSDKGAPRIILDLLCLGLPMLACTTGEYNIIEIERNLTKKMPDVLPAYREYLPLLNLDVIPLPSPGEIKKLFGLTSDKDIPVLASAIIGNVDFLVTGDKKDFIKLKGKRSFKILSPAEFLDSILPEVLKVFGEGKGVTVKK